VKHWRKVILFFCVFIVNLWADESKSETDSKTETATSFKGITITEKHIALMRGIADFLFSHPSDTVEQKEKDKTQKEIIQAVIPAKSEKILKVGIPRDNLPFTAMRNGTPIGFDVDLIRLLFENKAVHVEIVPIETTEIEENISTGKVHVVLGCLIKNTSSNSTLGNSDCYLSTDIAAVSWKKPKKDMQKFSFEGKCIGVIKNSFFEDYIRNANILNAKVVTFPTNGEMLEHLLKESKGSDQYIDAFLSNSYAAKDMVAKYRELELSLLGTKQEIVVLAPKDSPWLGTINQKIKKIEGSDKLSETKRHWGI
jgi:ABC-type amino acid transport substrate-binding protein